MSSPLQLSSLMSLTPLVHDYLLRTSTGALCLITGAFVYPLAKTLCSTTSVSHCPDIIHHCVL